LTPVHTHYTDDYSIIKKWKGIRQLLFTILFGKARAENGLSNLPSREATF
jgi:hypothetical protein